MTIRIIYKKKEANIALKNVVLFVNDKFDIHHLRKHVTSNEFKYISDLIKNEDTKRKFLVFRISSKKTIFLIAAKKDSKNFEFENLGAKFFDKIKNTKLKNYIINTETLNYKLKNFLGYFLHGI